MTFKKFKVINVSCEGTLHFDRCLGQCGFREEDLEKEEPKDEAQRWLASIVPDRPSWVEERVTQRYLDRFKGLFSEKGFDRLPKRRPWDHAIELKADFTPTNCKVYPLNGPAQRALDALTRLPQPRRSKETIFRFSTAISTLVLWPPIFFIVVFIIGHACLGF